MAQDQQPLNKSAGEPKPRQKTCTGFCCCKLLVVVYGFLFVIFGLILIGIGAYIETIHQDRNSVNDYVRSPSILAIVVGIFMLIFGFIGIIGAIKENLVLLKIFLAIIIIVFILQVIIGIIAFVYREKAYSEVAKQMKFAIENYQVDRDIRQGIDAVQRTFKCCGIKRASDWEFNEQFKKSSASYYAGSVPDSCCEEEVEGCGLNARKNLTLDAQGKILNMEGCSEKFRVWIEKHLDVVGACALAFAIPQILGIFLVYTYITKVEDRRYLFQYSKYKQRLMAA